jgi:hypothetical protein
MRTHIGFAKAIALVMTFAASLVLAVQPGCNGSKSPTAVAPPPPEPAPTPVPTGARLTFIVDNDRDEPGEILFDGRSIWAGQVADYYDDFRKILTLDEASVTPGVHTVTFRAPGRRAVEYTLSGWVDLYWGPEIVRRVGRWSRESAWLKTGRDWTREIVFPVTPPD